MIQDIAPKVFDNAMRFVEPRVVDTVLAYRNRTVVARRERGALRLPTLADFGREGAGNLTYLFAIDRERFFLAGEEVEPPAGFARFPLQGVRAMQPRHAAFACFTGVQLAEWYRGNVFCGRCGGRTEPSATERALVCSACGRTVYPKISPAVIVAVVDGDRILLTKYAGRSYADYALVAGFCEIGETAEETVTREVFEECGVRVKNVRYYKSQPWGIAGDLLLGYVAELDGSDEIVMDSSELSVAQWMRRADLDIEDDGVSLTREMMRAFKNQAF